ncbi:conserved hypothetical protein [Desulfatibacillum aliphaticivorans]|uniref:DUF3592 domain-containing protein n=1 Tax=Desulfatibacillum aliphaticivorans TaxID=218208 RepID=B8FA73_DESAL|nr:DUF3592 domain-containing protein [Desulfatibacillum aliphaticivorans]ACL03169.1 conserved hypothetical protein [Desulfatibacillum aliphaticivorans]
MDWFGWGLVLVGAAGITAFLVNLKRAAASRNWPKVIGTVVISEFSRSKGTDQEQYSYTENVRIVYDFIVYGRVYQRDCVRIGSFLDVAATVPGVSNAADIYARYRQGKPCTVYYNPNNPKVCCLEPGGEVSAVIGLVLCAGLLAWGFSRLF